MPQADREKLNRIEELKTKLYSKNYRPRSGHQDEFSSGQKKDVPDSWNDKDKSKLSSGEKFFVKTSVFKKFFIFSIIFFFLAIGYAAYQFFAGGNSVSNNNIDISILGSTFTGGGEELPLQIGITNKNSSALELVDLIVEYPKSSASSAPDNLERTRESLGGIPAGAIRNENIKVVLFGEQGSTRQIKVSIEYRIEGSNAIFVKEKTYDVSISSSPIDLVVDAPTEVTPNQDIILNVKETLNAAKPVSNMLLKVDYPVGFVFDSASVPTSFGNNVWELGDLAPGAERTISIHGKMIDVFDGEEKTFRVWSGLQSKSDKSSIEVVFSSVGHTVTVQRPFIEAKLYINGIYQNEYASSTNNMIEGEIKWANNLDTKINDLVITAKISGNAVNQKSIKAQRGFYDSLNDSIIWSKDFEDDLKEVNPGDSGSVQFSFTPLSSSLGSILSNPLINIDVSISGKQSTAGDTTRELNNTESKIIRIISDVGFANKMLYYSGPFTNSGPIPPKVETETTYTVVWNVTNTANNVSKAQVVASLPPWVRFAGKSSPESEDLTFNATTKEITWNIGTLPKGSGISTAGREVAFKVVFTPSLSQLNTTPVLINDAVLTGFDDFAKVNVRVNKNSLTTNLPNDPSFPDTGGRVVE